MTMSALKPTNELFEGHLAAVVRPIHNTAATNIPGRTTGNENLIDLVILRPPLSPLPRYPGEVSALNTNFSPPILPPTTLESMLRGVRVFETQTQKFYPLRLCKNQCLATCTISMLIFQEDTTQ